MFTQNATTGQSGSIYNHQINSTMIWNGTWKYLCVFVYIKDVTMHPVNSTNLQPQISSAQFLQLEQLSYSNLPVSMVELLRTLLQNWSEYKWS